MNPFLSPVVYDLMLVALQAAIVEAADVPIAPGSTVGHINMKEFGGSTGTLISYDGDYAVVSQETKEVRWLKVGMVDVRRVVVFLNQLLKLISNVIEDDIGLLPDDPIPGCTCDHCRTCTNKQHEAAQKRLDTKAAEEVSKEMWAQYPNPKDTIN
jgi:hypothetical protein